MRVELLTDWPDAISPGTALWLDGTADPLRIQRLEAGGRVPVLYFEGLETREAVEGLVGRYLEGPERELDEGSYFWADLIGLRVEDAAGSLVGELVDIFRAGGNEVYHVVGPQGERLVPALRDAVLEIDLDGGRIIVAPDDSETV